MGRGRGRERGERGREDDERRREVEKDGRREKGTEGERKR